MVYVLLWAVAIAASAAIFLIFNQRFLYKQTVRNYTPFMQKRFARHPDGQISTIAYDYPNHNDKHMWKFNEWSEEIHAEKIIDIIEQPGAEYGNGFFIFRCNRDGTEEEWNEPAYASYFAKQKKLAKLKNQAFFEKISIDDFDRFIADMEAADKSRKLDDKFMEAQIKKLEHKEEEEKEKKDKDEKKEEKAGKAG